MTQVYDLETHNCPLQSAIKNLTIFNFLYNRVQLRDLIGGGGTLYEHFISYL